MVVLDVESSLRDSSDSRRSRGRLAAPEVGPNERRSPGRDMTLTPVADQRKDDRWEAVAGVERERLAREGPRAGRPDSRATRSSRLSCQRWPELVRGTARFV